jgi:CHAT domain-containing protein
MGDPLRVDPKASVPASAPTDVPASAPATRAPQPQQPERSTAGKRTEYRNGSAQKKADIWDVRWQQIQGRSDTVTWSDHFHVCGLKYRFRNYDQLFRCLDLLDAKIAAGGSRVPHADLVQRSAPVFIGWLRSSAYAELGETDVALKWANSAWTGLPEAYRDATSNITNEYFGREDLKSYEGVAALLGSVGRGDEAPEFAAMFQEGRNNPAALDLRPSTIAMSISVERALLHQRLGETQDARAALADLKKWEDLRRKGGMMGLLQGYPMLRGKAQLLSIGPLFALGDYPRVIFIYEGIGEKVAWERRKESGEKTLSWTLLFPWTLVTKAFEAPIDALMTPSDARLFAVAVEDVSNALIYAESLARVGKTNEARAMLDTLLAMRELPAMGNLYWVTLYERGALAIRQGQRGPGIRYLTQSVDAIESVRSTISFEAAKIGFAGDKQTVYGALIAALAESGDWNQAFVYAERAKARALVDLLAQRHDLAPPPAADDKVRELFARASTVENGVDFATTSEAVRGVKVVSDARNTLGSVAPEAASLVSVHRVEVAEIGSRLGRDETLIDYYVQGDDLYAFVLNGTSIRGYKLSAKGLDEDIRAFRDAIERRSPNAREIGRSLFTRLLAPLVQDIKGTGLTIAPHGPLHYLPFAALSDGEHDLIDRFSTRLVPSASTLLYLRTDKPSKPGRLLALGNPDLGDRKFDLPNAQTEAVSVAALFPDSRALVRAEASKSAVKELGNGFAILHFATHGRFDASSPLSSGLYLARGNESDGILTVSDLYSLRWDVDLVTLSACETGLGKIASGDDVIGLTRGFLYAGARSIVASLWEVDDAATSHLMQSFYRNLEGHDKREALRLAQIETRQQYPQPWYWAAFNILGRAD